MPMTNDTYDRIRPRLQVGDVIAFGGDNPLSAIIKLLTNSVVSHSGTILEEATDARGPMMVESTVRLDGNNPTVGVKSSLLDEIVHDYSGEVWWLPLAARLRGPHGFDRQAFVDCITAKIGTPFDLLQGAGVVLWEFLNRRRIVLPAPHEELGCFYCSELVAAAFERGGLVGRINASKVSPGDLCSWWLYEPQYVQLKGNTPVRIRPYNSEDPSRWERLIAAIEALRRDKDSFVVESTRLRNLARQAIGALREAGATNNADQLEAQL